MARSMIEGAIAAAAGAALVGCAAAGAAAPSALPPTVSRSDVCAILARPEAPGADETADPAARARAAGILRASSWHGVRWRYDRRRRLALGAWGRCADWAGGAHALAFSADGRHAKTQGGYQAAPLHGGWGHCIFERTPAGAWALVACEVTEVS